MGTKLKDVALGQSFRFEGKPETYSVILKMRHDIVVSNLETGNIEYVDGANVPVEIVENRTVELTHKETQVLLQYLPELCKKAEDAGDKALMSVINCIFLKLK